MQSEDEAPGETAAEPSEKDADDLAQLMADSPASAEMSVVPNDAPAEKSSAPASPDEAAPAAAAPAEAKPSKFAPLLRVADIAKPVTVRVARVLSKPLELVPPRVRDDIGWFSLVTLFLALAVMVALALFR